MSSSVEPPNIRKVKNLLLIFQDEECMYSFSWGMYVLYHHGVCIIVPEEIVICARLAISAM